MNEGQPGAADEESCLATSMSESTPLHANTTTQRRHRSASNASSYGSEGGSLTISSIIATSPPTDRSSYISSNWSTTSMDTIFTNGVRSSAATPMASNLTTPVVSNVSSDDRCDDDARPVPSMPSMGELKAACGAPQAAIRPVAVPPRGADPSLRQINSPRQSSSRRDAPSSGSSGAPSDCAHSRSLLSRIKISTTLVLLVMGLLLCIFTTASYIVRGSRGIATPASNGGDSRNDTTVAQEKEQHARHEKARRMFDEIGRYIIDDYDALPTFSSFLPGVAGIYGKPLWSFYVNRGQGIASFGVKSKDYPIMEYHSANNAYQDTPLLGFRTFYQGHRVGKTFGKSDESFLVEPFDTARTRFASSMKSGDDLPTRSMYIGSNEMQIREVDRVNQIETNVTYFILPEEDFGAFVRSTTITNLDDRPLRLSVLDGLARIQPAGGKLNLLLKTIGRTIEGWMRVHLFVARYHGSHESVPFFSMSTGAADTASVAIEEAGHFSLAGVSKFDGAEMQSVPIVYDTGKVFGRDTTLTRPLGLLDATIKSIIDGEQYGAAKTSSAFAAAADLTIHPGQSIKISTFYGRADTVNDVQGISERIYESGFERYKLSRARALMKQITANVETNTANALFDRHVQQMYLDNSLRGGMPVLLGESDSIMTASLSADEDSQIKVFHLFSRIHGDLERDYNDFQISPTFFSEGPGNYRDVAQNRRNDVIFNPRVGAFNAKLMLSLIQMDGYNPLHVEAVEYTIDDTSECDRLATIVVGHADGYRADRERLARVLCSGPFRPGQLIDMIQNKITTVVTVPELINTVVAAATITPMATPGDGLWADHWTYILDLIDSYLRIYPDREESFLYEERLTYYFSQRVVRPRSQKYVLSTSYNGVRRHVRQLNSSYDDPSRIKRMQKFVTEYGRFKPAAHLHHDVDGHVLESSPIAKLFILAALKFATRDAWGMGIEYEGGMPGWNDAMNGLVGMIGSGMPETYELKLLLKYIRQSVSKYNRPIEVPAEVATLIRTIEMALDELGDDAFMPNDEQEQSNKTVPAQLFHYWDTVASAREEYRTYIHSLSGTTQEFSPADVTTILDRWAAQIDLGIQRAQMVGSHGYDKQDELLRITPTYFAFNVTKWVRTGETNSDGLPLVNATEMAVQRFPLFLEGVVRKMKTVDKKTAEAMYNAVKKSGLRDEALRMYTISSSLVGQSYDLGRMMGFSPGWLENQSVWMHMSYKYYLELLKKGLHDEFFAEMKSGMLPFIEDKTYGRSLLECSSFIASSAFVDPSIRGQGFLARLSGSTAEFLTMWTIMMIGPTPFFVNDISGGLEMQLIPTLPHWLWKHEKDADCNEQQYSVAFHLFSTISVTYYISKPMDVFGIPPKRYEIGLRDGSQISVQGPTIPSDVAAKIRRVVFIDYIRAYIHDEQLQ